uniref:Small EDRK-rich factor-like N-terminal domain-containing protein n=1 Tax=Salmo trutta TaxID=8032 RepID=A0A674A4A9_SALTR
MAFNVDQKTAAKKKGVAVDQKTAAKKKGVAVDQKTAAKAALVHTCPVCRVQSIG